MPWWDWIRETAEKVTTSIRTGLRGIIGLPEEIEVEIPSRPATLEQIEEALEDMPVTSRFIEEELPPEATRLARGVLESERLTNVYRNRTWTAQDIHDIVPGPREQVTARAVLIAPDGSITHVDVAFPTGEQFTDDEFIRRAASALDDDFVSNYDVGRSAMVRDWVATIEPYVQTYTPIG